MFDLSSLLLSLFPPFDHVFVELSREVANDTPNVDNGNVFSNIFSNANLFGQLVDTLMIVSGAVGTGVALIKKSINAKADEIARETKKQIEDLDKRQTNKIDNNERLIIETKKDLCNQITNSETRIKDNFIDLKENTKDIKDIVQKLDDKSDRSAEMIAANKTRIDTHEGRLSTIEKTIMFTTTHRYYESESSDKFKEHGGSNDNSNNNNGNPS